MGDKESQSGRKCVKNLGMDSQGWVAKVGSLGMFWKQEMGDDFAKGRVVILWTVEPGREGPEGKGIRMGRDGSCPKGLSGAEGYGR